MKRSLVPFTLALLVAGVATSSAQARIGALRVEYLVNPLGLDTPQPRFSWVVSANERGTTQAAYRVTVATTPLKLVTPDIWDSGRVESADNAQVVYTGPVLQPRTRYHWTVEAWDGKGRKAMALAEPASFETGLMGNVPRQVQWIGLRPGNDEERCPFVSGRWIWLLPSLEARRALFRTTFTLAPDERVTRAELHFSGPGSGQPWEQNTQHRLYLNDTPLRSFSALNTDPRLLIVTRQLKVGTNTLAIDTPYYPSRAILATLVLRLTNGRERRIHTDASWRCRLSTTPLPADTWRSEPTDRAPWDAVTDLGAFGEDAYTDDPRYRLLDVMVPAAYLRKPFAVSKPIRAARLYVTAYGLYEAYLNGTRLGRDVLAPGWTDYQKRIQYQTYDATNAVRSGANVLGAIVAAGWATGRTGMGQNLWGFEKALWAELRLEYADGTSESVSSDTSWRGTSGPIRKADLLDGETYDARRELGRWAEAGFDDKAWRPAFAVHPALGVLEGQSDPPVRAVLERPTVKLTSPSSGVQIFDLGQNIVGWARLTLTAPAGTEIQLRFAEMLNKDGTLFTDNLRTAVVIDRYTAKGGGPETFEPRFTFHGFRYVEVSGAPQVLGPNAVTGIVVHSDLPVTGRFETSNTLLNQLQSNIAWGQRGNFVSIPTDCPQRDERLGWSGDIQVFARTATFNMDSAAFLAKFVVDLADTQRPNGSIADVAPTTPHMGDGHYGWGDAMVFVPWTLYEVYGDTRVLARHYDAMKRWVDYRTAGARDYLNDAWSYGDWVSPPPQTPNNVLGPLYHAHAARLLASAAAVLGNKGDAAQYTELFEKIKAAFVEAYVAADGKLASDTQTAYATALRYDMLPADKREAATRHLLAALERADNHLATGFLGTSQLVPALSENGQTEAAYWLLLKETHPSWLYTVKNGATTMWERWDSYSPETGPSNKGDMNSYNHYAFGVIGQWMYAHLAGIGADPTVPGFRRLVLRPYPGPGLTHVRGEYDSIRGKIVSDWTLAAGTLTWDIEVPVHATALVYVPKTTLERVKEGGRPAAKSPGIRFVRQEGNAAVFEVGSGTYRFTASLQ